MTASNPDRFDRIEELLTGFGEDLSTVKNDLNSLKEQTIKTNEQVKKWDGRLWGLTLALITTAWAGIIGATAVVITRSLTGS